MAAIRKKIGVKSGRPGARLVLIAGLLALGLLWVVTPPESSLKRVATWQALTSPGPLSGRHAFLEADCGACHTAVSGVTPANCISCHANSSSLLRAQPTAFHANIDTCKECHLEHQGRSNRPSGMDHATLSRLGLRQLADGDPRGEHERVRQLLKTWMAHVGDDALPHVRVTSEELILNCVACHSEEDPHVAYLGDACANCHATTAWTIPEYIHPPSSSKDCAECHAAPPSHFMPMFNSMCAKMLGKKPDSIKQCYVCHEISAWNNMKDNPWHKKTMSHIPSR